jgi:hypothetical protein
MEYHSKCNYSGLSHVTQGHEVQDWTTEDSVIDSCALGNSHRLTASVCVDFLSQYWAGNLNYSNSDDSEERTIVLAELSRCNWEAAEQQLNLLFDYKTLISDGCWAELPRLLCRYLFRPCSGTPSTILWDFTMDECLHLKNKYQGEMPFFEQSLKYYGACLTIPDCNSTPKPESDPTEGVS